MFEIDLRIFGCSDEVIERILKWLLFYHRELSCLICSVKKGLIKQQIFPCTDKCLLKVRIQKRASRRVQE